MTRLDTRDTIVAIATATGPAVRGMIRLSGPDAWRIVEEMFQAEGVQADDDDRIRRVATGYWRGERLRRPIPVMRVLWAAPRTFTTQPLAEIHAIGAPALLRAILSDCLNRGARLAEPGEFTLRAFLAGRIDLTQAEAVLGVVEADTPAQLDAALRQLAGGLADPVRSLRDALLDELAYLEATLDFTEEPDVAPLDRSRLAEQLDAASQTVNGLADQLRARDRADARPLVLLHGRPNAGKSRLFNALLGRPEALVSAQPGTTRDYLQAACDCAGRVVDLVDTAGVDDPENDIERRAQTLRAELAARADLILLCGPIGDSVDPAATPAADTPTLRVVTKADLDLGAAFGPFSTDTVATSAATGQGLVELKAAIAARTRSPAESLPAPAATAARCHESLVESAQALSGAAAALESGLSDEFVALDLRAAVDALGLVVGAIVTDDLLDRVFSRFCIGK